MNPKGVRLACPECTWSCVMRYEGDIPDGVHRVVEGVPYCPNCKLPMTPVASVDTAPRPSPGLSEGLSLAERLAKIREAEQDVADAKEEWDEAKERATSCKKAYDADVETLCSLIKRLTSVPQPQPRAPLLEEMENPACLCSHRKEQHEDDATAPEGNGKCIACVCELFELQPDTATITEHVGTIAAALSYEALRQRLAALRIVVDVPEIEAWSVEEYDAVVEYVASFTDTGGDPVGRPHVLPLAGDPAPADDTPPLPGRRHRKKQNALPVEQAVVSR